MCTNQFIDRFLLARKQVLNGFGRHGDLSIRGYRIPSEGGFLLVPNSEDSDYDASIADYLTKCGSLWVGLKSRLGCFPKPWKVLSRLDKNLH